MLQRLMAVEPVGGERLDWHFARLYYLLSALLGKREDSGDEPTMTDWLLERIILPKTEAQREAEEETAEDAARRQFTAFMQGFAARTGATISAAPPVVAPPPLSVDPEE